MHPRLEGFLVKRGERVKSWKRRFFTFENGQLAYKKSDKEDARIIRREYIENVLYWNGIRHGFCVHLSSGRVLYMSASSEDEANLWYNVFEAYLIRQQRAVDMMRLAAKKILDPIEESALESLECV
ncbi:hypothetical protein P43SY_005667 [Pythium insidiosum]|uniref:PH domain-containing protein n=1 Tax=Pythium insidiosum TaxID=114742 RepID=A0AAD5LBE0_PYTIN|nr:hypothetical protein P43SY_005667 [Pythium insidiosum]KAJ0397897.1 hypothetical protein ATCC90586_009627 [Pythium insidiosum]